MELNEGDIETWKSDLRDAFAEENLDWLSTLLSCHPQTQKACNKFVDLLKEETWIFTELCLLGAEKIIERLLRLFTLDVNVTQDGMSAIQLASEAGHASVVELLLNSGAKLNESVWDEDSEFYLATLNGHGGVMNALLQANSELIFDTEVTYCLFYAACKGGHMNMVHRWLTPGIDVNRVRLYVPSLDGCELQYPLFAACQGGHYKIASFLISDLNARLTKEICAFFPEIAYQLVREIFITSAYSTEQSFLMSDLGINHVVSAWFEFPERTSNHDETTSRPESFSDIYETKIDLSKNSLSSLPSEIWELSSLVELNLSHNPLTELPCPGSLDISLHTNSLTSLLLSKCGLKKLDVYIFQLPNLETLDASHNQLESLDWEEDSPTTWKCRQLKILNLSHNALSCLPSLLQECVSIETLNVSYNVLTSLCSPWQCPMKTLDVSHNQISDFPASCDKFWADSLHALNVSHNVLSQLHESMVKMNVLKNLDVSHNGISTMPRGIIWSCPLIHLDLSHNKLGVKHSPSHKNKHMLSIQKSYTPDIELPASCLSTTLHELFLNHNDLYDLPYGLCHLHNLSFLHIQCNPNLTSLPLEMGMLWNLLELKAEGIKVDDKEIQLMVNALNDNSAPSYQAYEFIMSMEQRRRECMHHDVIKMVVFGCKNSGGQCILRKLIKQNKGGEYKHEHKSLYVSKWKLPHSKKFQTNFKRDLTFQTWEFPVSEAMSVTHPCFLTENSLYVIVHYAYYDEDNLETVSQQVAAIQASVTQPCIIVICVFHSSKDESYDGICKNLYAKISKKMKCHFVPFIQDDKPSLDLLLATIYKIASMMSNVLHNKHLLVDRKVPKLFIDILDRMWAMDKQSCSRDELLNRLALVPKDLQDTVDRRLRLQEYLLQVGAMLHYNVLMGDLWNLVVLDPVWLYDLLNSFMKFLNRGRPQIEIENVRRFAAEKIEEELFPAFISLLEIFNIGMRIEEGSGKESLLIPSLLPKQPPPFLSTDISYVHSTSRFYCLPAIPSALWSHVIGQLIPAFERFTNPTSHSVPKLKRENSDDTKKSFRRGTRNSVADRGLRVKNKGIQFWSTGIMVWHDQGLVVVEEVQYEPQSGTSLKGILVTVKTRDDEYSLNASPKQLAAIGVVTDELEEILELFNPNMMEYMTEYQPIALCPHCHRGIKPGQGVIRDEINHFQINICAQRILWEDHVFCGKNVVCLDQIMPEFMFLELPDQFRVRYDQLEFFDEKLGQGMVGSVLKGRYNRTDVALKSFYTPEHQPVFEVEEDPIYPNMGISDSLSQSMTQQDHTDTERKKILNAFLDLRREVSILSKLKHKCIIAFLGVCVKRQLLLVLELAPLGSFRSCLTAMKKEKNIPVYKPTASDPTVVTTSVFGKDLTYKILLQISSGLSYLHSQSIIFRDLKPDNILVMSLDLDTDINVKVSDYGISRFSTARGVSGLVGTVCYMAPEVLAKQTYTYKVDVYSLGIVMFESVTGISPLDLLGTNQKPLVSEIAKSCTSPMHVKLFKVSCNFPFLEGLMEECWNYRMDERPSIHDVIGKMMSDQFLLLHDVLWADEFSQRVMVTCIYYCQTGGRTSLWISESVLEGSLRLLSVYDVTTSLYTVRRKPVLGPKITAMARVREKIWLISEGCKQIEEIVRSTQNKFEVKKGTLLDEEPSCLMCHTWRPSKAVEDHAFVLIGHTNGTITTYHVHTQLQHKVVTTTTMLMLHTDFPVSAIVAVSNDCLIAAADHDLSLLTIQEQASGDGLLHPSISFNWSFSLYKSLGILGHIDKLVTESTDSVWCSFDGKNKLVKFNWKEQSVKENLVFFTNSKRKKVEVVSDGPLNVLPPSPTSPSRFGSSVSGNSSVRPAIPMRRSTLTDEVGITSMCLGSNLLAVGTDIGGLFLLPISDKSFQDVCPFQLPLLVHPEQRKGGEEDGGTFRSHSDSVASSRSAARNSSTNSFSVSKIIAAGNDNKLVSLIKLNSDECVFRKEQTLQKRQARRKRTGGIFPPGYNPESEPKPICKDGAVSNGTFEIRITPYGSKNSITNCAEIAIWADVSDVRLDVIKGYKEGFC